MKTENEITVKDLIFKIKDIITHLVKRWIILLLAGLIGGIIGGLYAQFQKPTYTASITFALEDEKGGGSGLSGALGLASSLGFDLGGSAGGAFSGPNLIEFIKSRKMVEQALLKPIKNDLNSVSLAEYFIQMKNWRKNWEKKGTELNEIIQFLPNSNRKLFSIQQDSVLGIIYESLLKGSLSVGQKDKKVSIINIDVRSGDQFFAKIFAETLADEVSDFYIETKSKKAKLNLEILEKQADSVRRELNAAITGVASANDNNFALNSALSVPRTSSLKRQVDVQANTAVLTELIKNLELAKVTLRKETPLIQVIDKPILPLKKEKIGRLKTAFFGSVVFFFIVTIFLLIQKWWHQILK